MFSKPYNFISFNYITPVTSVHSRQNLAEKDCLNLNNTDVGKYSCHIALSPQGNPLTSRQNLVDSYLNLKSYLQHSWHIALSPQGNPLISHQNLVKVT